MSFNRGMKRDSFGNRSFNNRSGGGGNMGSGGLGGGGGGGGMGGSRGSGGGGGGSGMNPWEGGMMPGPGILPTPNNNLSLASPQAQLAIASNLLSNLLRSQQDPQPQVPSLLSLGNNFGRPGPNFHGQQNFGPGRFNDRQMRHPNKNNRAQPYNKMGNRARDGLVGRRGPSAQQSRAPQSGNQRMNGNQIQHRNDKSSKPNPASKQNQAAKKEQQDVKTSDNEKAETPVVKSEPIEKSEGQKQTRKEGEKEDEIMETSSTENKDGKQDLEMTEETSITEDTSKDANVSTTDKEVKTGSKKSEARHAESRYAEVPMNRMFCHICNKHMWDGYSFENHLRGRAHQLMMDKQDESYKMKVDLMRHELRVTEEQRELSLNNSKRRGKKLSVDLNVREYCTMCDLNFYGTLSSHRKSEKHQQLKTFLHPRCFPCVKEFPSRIEYDEHCLTPAHMKNAVVSEEQRKNKKKEKLAKGEAEVRTAEDEEKDVGVESKNDKEEESLQDNTEYLTDITPDVTDTKYKIPSFKYCRQNQITIGKSLVKEVQGYYCEKCRRFMITPEDMTAHLRSITHYRSFVQTVKAMNAAAENVASKTADESEGNEKGTKDGEEYEGNWKRRKVADSEEDDVSEQKEACEANGNSVVHEKSDGDEKYDPLEADGESDDEHQQGNEEHAQDKQEVQQDTEEKKTPADKMWADIDNDNDLEIGNLLDEMGDEKDQSVAQDNTITKNETVLIPQMKSRGRGGGGYPRGRGARARRSRRM